MIRRPKGSGSITTNGYLRHGQELDHRLVMGRYLGRELETDEIVHHINRNTLDNRIENLDLMGKGSHTSLHMLRHSVINGTKICDRCGVVKSAEMFPKRSDSNKPRSICKACFRVDRWEYKQRTGK